MSDSAIPASDIGILKLFILAILAGAYIALAHRRLAMASFNLDIGSGDFGLGKLVSASVFPVGLMMVVPAGGALSQETT